MKGVETTSVTLCAPAKINLTLDVLGLRPDGYHEIASIMQTITLSDHVTVTTAPEGTGISVSVSGHSSEGVPTDEQNLAWKAAKAFGATDVAIHIEKNIPSQAGLGGGSSDAAATLAALNLLHGRKKSRPQLARIARGLGSDVPFFLYGGTARVEGRGERITPLKPCPRLALVIVKPLVGVSTAEAYRLLDEMPGRRSARATIRWPRGGYANDFEQAIFAHYPQIASARAALREAGAKKVLLCGSGSAVLGIARDLDELTPKVYEANVGLVFNALTCQKGVHVE